ncbi:single-stranded DNA-binding protein [Streptomyces goshikiensis]|uniref:single-stranded DNA-binding protein n=1 Tax=Streptomyces goshikiensis TaxID=1942 RepID=UPI003698292C
MTERAGQRFDGEAVAKALGTRAQDVTDPAYGEGQHFQVTSDSTFLSLDTFPASGVSRITTKGARIELFGGMLPRVEDEGIVFLQKDSDHEHSTVSLSPDGGMTMGYQVDTGPVPIDGLPQDIEDTEQIITRHEAVNTPAAEPEPTTSAKALKPPEKPVRTLGAFPDVRPMTQVGAVADPPANGQVAAQAKVAAASPQEIPSPSDDALKHPAQFRDEAQAAKQETAETGAERVKLVGRIGRTPTVRETAGGKLVAKFPLAVHLEDGTTTWHDVLAFNDRAAALKKRIEAGELVKGNEIEVVGYRHERDYQGRDGTTKTAQEIYSVAVKRR